MTSLNKDDAGAGPSQLQSKGRLSQCYACMHKVTTSGHLRPLIPASEPRMMSSEFLIQEQSMNAGAQKLCRCAVANVEDEYKLDLLRDSGSEEDEDQDDFDWDQESVSGEDSDDDIWMAFDSRERRCDEREEWQKSARFDGQVKSGSMNEDEHASVKKNVVDERIENVTETIGNPENMDFLWSEDFTSFTGQKETYRRVPGPTYISQSPTDIFCQIWDPKFLENIAKETNEYAWQLISQLSDPDLNTSIPTYLNSWTEITVRDLYRYFAVLIYMTFCHRSKIYDYWDTGVMGMPSFREIMSRNKFLLLSKFLHFVNNNNLISNGYDRKISKVGPLIDHCNKKFADLYTPSQYLSLDESLLLWKGRLSWTQCIQSKAARFGIKSFELCEAETGYLLQYKLYTGKDIAMHPGPPHGFNNKTAKVVLQLMERYLDAGHVLVMDNWYNQLPLTRYLKNRHTDVLGTINRRQHDIPHSIRDLNPKNLKRGETVALHSGDIALVAWRDVKLVTLISTYHRNEMVLGTRAGQAFSKPVAVDEYNRYMVGVDLKDHKLSTYLMERKRNMKWYMKVFKRLFNTSLLNAFIIYTRNPVYRMYSHRQFRLKVAEELLSRNLRESSLPPSVPNKAKRLARLEPGNHFPIHTEAVEGPQKMKHRQLRCVRCTAQKKRVLVTMRCKLCDVPLCIGKCWEDYHKLVNL